MRLGFVDHWTQLRVLNPGLRVMANAAPDYLASPEMRGQAEGAFLEGMMGKPYSLERQADGWNRMMARYRAAFRDTAAPHAVVFQIYSAPDDHRLMRYGLCSALLDDGYFAINAASLQQAMPWYDEYDAALGAAIDAPPTRPDASGLWLRRYRGGIVVVNPQPSALGIELPQGYRRLAGSISPDVNNGRPVSALTVQAKDGLILER